MFPLNMKACVLYLMATNLLCLIHTGSLQSTYLQIYGSSSELEKDLWHCIKQCLWAVLEAVIENKFFDLAWGLAKQGWDFLVGLADGSGWISFGGATEFVKEIIDILLPLSYIRDIYNILKACTECLY